tara:strand:+ start:847 stop:1512 length:666 start_codon:yes stop_codon:yes gene_type:complete
MKINTKKFLENKFILYLVFFLALISIFSYITTNNYASVLLFILISLLTKYFSKNMIVILGAAIIGTYLVTLINGNTIVNNRLEGYENKNKKSNTKKSKKTKTGFANQKLSPTSLDNLPSIDNLLSKDDEAKQTEAAYDLLEKNVGGENIKNIAGNTKQLLGKQVQLMDQMKQITPILQQTMGLVNNLDLSSLTEMAEQVTNLLPENMDSLAGLNTQVLKTA